jgi:hypothetical protein
MWASRCIGGLKVPCVVFYIIVVIVIFAYGYYIRKSGRPDVLEHMITEDPSVQNLDGWAMTHIFLYLFLGFWYPDNHLQALGVSLLWEGFEDTLGRRRLTVGGSRLQLIGGTDGDTGAPTGADDKDDGGFWYGRYTTDTAYNLMGYIVGSALSKRYWPKDSCTCKTCSAAPARQRGPKKGVY